MRVFWEKTGVLGPIYRLVGRGLSDVDIAGELNLAELRVQHCIAWMLRFLRFTDRDELVRHSSSCGANISAHVVADAHGSDTFRKATAAA